jgi:tetratricopeptide (TPR) repeat protein
MRLQYVIDAEEPEPTITPIADVSKLPGFVDYGQTYASAYDGLRHGDTSSTDGLITHLHRVYSAMMTPQMSMMMPEMVGQQTVVETELRAMADARRGKLGDAIAAMTRATIVEDSLPFEFGPPSIEKPSHELLGEMLLAAGRPGDARREFEIALKRTPGRSLALLDLARACRAAGDVSAAANAYRQLEANWKRADSAIAAVREARAGASRPR